MKLTMIDGMFVALGTYAERDIPKAAGFRWDPARKRWWTGEPSIAARLARYADETAASHLTAARAAIAASRASAADLDVPAPDGLSYRPFQLAGIAYAVARPAALIGDEMGLGKTIQAIGVINADPSIRAVLVLCPATPRLNWERELERWLVRPLSVAIATANRWPDTDVVIVNYDIADRLRDHLRARTWDLVIADEAHYLKNPKAQRTRAVLGHDARPSKGDPGDPGIRARRKLALTGTPAVNRPIELWTILHWLDPERWRNMFAYAQRYCGAYQSRFGWDFSGASHLDELQDRLRSTVMVRRLKRDVLAELPAKTRQIIAVPANGANDVVQAESAAYAEHEDRLNELRAQAELAKAGDDEDAYRLAVERLRTATRAAFADLSRRRHETAMAKVPVVVAHIRDALEGGSPKIVVFAHHHDVVAALAEALGEYQPVVLTGETAMADRQASVDRFQSDPACRVFIGSITAAGVAITLTASSHVVFAELDWVPGNMSQAEDRVHRIGQTEPVLVQHVVLDGSLDARMARVLLAKQEVLDRALDRSTDIAAGPALPLAPATEQATPSRIAQLAARLRPEHQQAVHYALRALAGMCDGAVARDGHGFNKVDARIGRELASRPALTPRQAALGYLIARKYRRQVPLDITLDEEVP